MLHGWYTREIKWKQDTVSLQCSHIVSKCPYTLNHWKHFHVPVFIQYSHIFIKLTWFFPLDHCVLIHNRSLWCLVVRSFQQSSSGYFFFWFHLVPVLVSFASTSYHKNMCLSTFVPLSVLFFVKN